MSYSQVLSDVTTRTLLLGCLAVDATRRDLEAHAKTLQFIGQWLVLSYTDFVTLNEKSIYCKWSSTAMATRLQTEKPRERLSKAGRDVPLLSSSKRPYWLWAPPSLLRNGYRGLLTGGCGIALQAGRSRVRFPIGSFEISTRDIIWEGGKGGRCVGLTLSNSCADCLEIWGALTSWNCQDLSRPVQGSLYLMYVLVYTGCFTTCGHYCTRWFPRSLW